ncbi:MAG: methylmalonate-semialdehyde dehydrogenase (CoA acylating) [Zetaproteobacteria bacterium]|nr:methylmalonate-semialdehyde dehydrogenase (CoA acylating) [Pseudobdellovibrionaceae bacterium]
MIKNFIDGNWTTSYAKESVDVINPANCEVLAQTPLGTQEDVNSAVSAAKKAFLTWRSTPAIERIQYLFKLKSELEKHAAELSLLITREHGKTLLESKGSVRRAIQMVETATGIPSLMMGENFEDIARGIDSSSIKRPIGVFAGIAPFNFPAMVPFWFWPFAIACGNTYVLKASERVPLTSLKIFEILDNIGLPKGVMNLVHGGKDVVNALCTHKDVKGISFVGSTEVAEHVYTTACAHGKRVQALGGAKNVMVVLPDAMDETTQSKTINSSVDSIVGCAGERCLAGSLLLGVKESTYEKLKIGVVNKVKSINVGSGEDPKTHMGPLISEQARERICRLVSRAVEQGAKILVDGREGVEHLPGYFLKPTVLCDVEKHMEIAQVEVFGPVVLLSKTESLESAISWINEIPYANTTTLFTNSGASARKFVYEVDPSMIGINIGVPAPMSFFSFGGSKTSFYGDVKAHGKECINFFTETYTTIYRWYDESSIWAE